MKMKIKIDDATQGNDSNGDTIVYREKKNNLRAMGSCINKIVNSFSLDRSPGLTWRAVQTILYVTVIYIVCPSNIV